MMDIPPFAFDRIVWFFRKQLLVFGLFWLSCSLTGQSLELGIALGTSNYLGDLTPSSLWTSVGETKPSFGLLAKMPISKWGTIRTGIHYGTIAASDADALLEKGRLQRNLSFKSSILEFSLIGEFNLFGFETGGAKRAFSPYLFSGVVWFHFRPQASYQGQWYDLQPLGTEGQGLPDQAEKYKLRQWAIPYGLGIKYTLNKHWNMGVEFGMRKTFTDYLDDTSNAYPNLETLAKLNGPLAAELSWRTDEISPEANAPQAGSPRGDPDDLDWYIFSDVFFTVNLNRKSSRRRKATRVKCFSF